MISSSINISSAGSPAVNTSTVISAATPQISAQKVGVSLFISDTDGNEATAELNINSESLKLHLLDSQEYTKEASLFFGSLFSGGFNAEYMWSLLGANTNEQINASHLSSALAGINNSVSSLSDAFQLHFNNWNIHLTTEDRDFLTRLKGIYGSVYNAALDYLILTNPYEGEINLTTHQIALFAGWGGFSAYSGTTDVELAFYDLIRGTHPTKSGGFPTQAAYLAQDNTYGYGITTLTIPTHEPLDLVEGEVGIFCGIGGFNATPSQEPDSELRFGYYYENAFYSDEEHTVLILADDTLLYIDLGKNALYIYNTGEDKYIPLTASGGVINGYLNPEDGKFYNVEDEGVYSEEIEGQEGVLYLDKSTNILYKYDSENLEFVPISSQGTNGVLVKGYLNSEDGKFYTDSLYTDEITPDVDSLYLDLLTFGIFYYDSIEEEYDRYHHKVSLDYLIFDPLAEEPTVPTGKYAVFIGEGGFDATSTFTEKKEVVFGYYHNGSFYEEANHTTLIIPEDEVIYLDLTEDKLYAYITNQYVAVSTTGGGSQGGSNIHIGYYYNGAFYSNRSGSYPNYSYSNPIQAEIDSVYIDNATGKIYQYTGFAYVSQTASLYLTEGERIVINKTGDADYTISHGPANASVQTASTNSDTSGNVNSGLTVDKFGHVTAFAEKSFNIAAIANSLLLRTITDAAAKFNYAVLTSNPTMRETLSNGEIALFAGQGGFTSTSFDDTTYIIGTGLLLNENTNELSVHLGFYSSGNNYAVQASQNGALFVTVPQSSPGTFDHSDLTHRFSTNYSGDTTHYEHDIDIISGLRTALDNINNSINTSSNRLDQIDYTTWSAEAPVIFSHTSETVNNETVYHNTIALQPLVNINPTSDEGSQYESTLLCGISDYKENVLNGSTRVRELTKLTINYSNAITPSTIVQRKTDGALAASYLLITDGLAPIGPVANGETAVYVGPGGFNAQYPEGTDYDIYTNFPETQPQDYNTLISARGIYDKIATISSGSGTPSDYNELKQRVSTLETKVSGTNGLEAKVGSRTTPNSIMYEIYRETTDGAGVSAGILQRLTILENRSDFVLLPPPQDYPSPANMEEGKLYIKLVVAG